MQTCLVTDDELDHLSTIFSKCISYTADALSVIIGETVQHKIGKTKLLDFSELDELTPAFSDTENVCCIPKADR
jgi:chemotaxis protein CheC